MKKQINHFAALVVALSLISCGNKQDNAQNGAGGNPAEATPVVTVKVPKDSVTTYSKYPISVEGVINSEARPKVSGYINEVLVDEGEQVKEGQVLFKLETESQSEEAEAAKADINAAQVQVDQLKPLVEKDIVSANQLETAKAKLKQAESNYSSIMASINYATVRSPVNGYVGKIRKRRGNLVNPSDAKPLTTVTEIDQVYAYFSMNEKDYLNFLKIAEGETRVEKIANLPEIDLLLANGDEFKHKGTIETVNSQVGKETGSVSFRVTFDNPEHMLTNGSTGQILIPNVYEDVAIVPQKSTFERQNHTYIMRVQKTDSTTIAVTDRIEIKDEQTGLYLIESGVEEGDEIVAEGVSNIPSGSPIQPNEQPFDSVAKPVKQVFK